MDTEQVNTATSSEVKQCEQGANWAREIRNNVANDSRKQPWKAVFAEEHIKQIICGREDLTTYDCTTAWVQFGGNWTISSLVT
ncbi:hypothetical protein B7494_g1007 [Chlorociboria aeruginascens]|nr:hypothetical protein B7494_g1007 [Chlorociboria aeruginascens]